VLTRQSDADKSEYLKSLFQKVYIKDVIRRNKIKHHPEEIEELLEILASSVGSLTNPLKLENAFRSLKKAAISRCTLGKYCRCLEEAFLIHKARRYDVKGKKYFEYPMKYYCADLGLRNARLNFRQQDESHIQENVIYNELVSRGFKVDVGVVPVYEKNEKGVSVEKKTEIDFVINRGMKRYYIQSALSMDDMDKARQELRPLLGVKDMFRKVVVSKTTTKPWFDDMGVLHLGIYDFLLDEKSLDF
jgi:predicted AAA+ superfamily ATPase